VFIAIHTNNSFSFFLFFFFSSFGQGGGGEVRGPGEGHTKVSRRRQDGKDNCANNKPSEFLRRRDAQQEEAHADLGETQGDQTQGLRDKVEV